MDTGPAKRMVIRMECLLDLTVLPGLGCRLVELLRRLDHSVLVRLVSLSVVSLVVLIL